MGTVFLDGCRVDPTPFGKCGSVYATPCRSIQDRDGRDEIDQRIEEGQRDACRVDYVQTQKMEQSRRVVKGRCVIVENGIAVAEGKVGKPARVEHAGCQGFTQPAVFRLRRFLALQGRPDTRLHIDLVANGLGQDILLPVLVARGKKDGPVFSRTV